MAWRREKELMDASALDNLANGSINGQKTIILKIANSTEICLFKDMILKQHSKYRKICQEHILNALLFQLIMSFDLSLEIF